MITIRRSWNSWVMSEGGKINIVVGSDIIKLKKDIVFAEYHNSTQSSYILFALLFPTN
jgi:hypothetical protein